MRNEEIRQIRTKAIEEAREIMIGMKDRATFPASATNLSDLLINMASEIERYIWYGKQCKDVKGDDDPSMSQHEREY